MISITFNGEKRNVGSSTVQGLLEELALTQKKLAVELNKEIVPRSTYDRALISEGDKIEIVHFVGGG